MVRVIMTMLLALTLFSNVGFANSKQEITPNVIIRNFNEIHKGETIEILYSDYGNIIMNGIKMYNKKVHAKISIININGTSENVDKNELRRLLI